MALILSGDTGVPVTTVTGTLPVANGGSGVTTSTGTGAVVLGTSPTLATPTFDSAQLPTISGTAPLYMCRAWVNFNGTGTVAIRASGNVSSITDLGVGNYRVNFTTAMSDANYSATIGWQVFSSVNIRSGGFDNYTTDYIGVYGGYMSAVGSFTAEDTTFISVAIFR